MGNLWERIRKAIGYRASEDRQAETVAEVVTRRQQEIRREWTAAAMEKRVPEADLYAKYEPQIEGLNQIALEIHDRYYAGKVNGKALPEIIHPEGVREAVRLAAEQAKAARPGQSLGIAV